MCVSKTLCNILGKVMSVFMCEQQIGTTLGQAMSVGARASVLCQVTAKGARYIGFDSLFCNNVWPSIIWLVPSLQTVN